MLNLLRILLLLPALVFATVAAAQFTPEEGVDFPNNWVGEEQDSTYDIGPDTSSIYYFFAGNPGEEFSFEDSLLGNYFQQYDPVRRRDLDYANLGILGSAYRPIVYEPRYRMGFDVGLHQFDIYQTPAPDLPFYRVDRAFTNLNYSQQGEQSDSYFSAQFSRNFSDGLNFSIDYRRLSQVGRRNQYPNQNARATALATGLWYHSRDDRYDGFLALAWNTIEQEDNGGILEEPIGNDGIETPSSAVVFLNEAQTRHGHRGIAYTHYYTFGRLQPAPGPPADSLTGRAAADSLGAAPPQPAGFRPLSDRRRFTLAHQVHYQSSEYKYFDEDVDNDQAVDYYGDFLTDARGVRFYLRHQMLENTFRLRTFRPGRPDEKGARRQRDLLEAGLLHRLNWLDLDRGDSTVTNLFLFGRLNFQLAERLRLRTFGQFALWDNAGDYRAFGELSIGLGPFGTLTATANNQLYEPTFLQERFFVNQEAIWQNDYKKTLETNLNVTYSLPQWRLELSGRYHLLNNYIYFDSLARPGQSGRPISIAQFVVKKDFSLGNFHLDNVVALQTASEDFIRVPDIFSKNSFYYTGKWFGVLQVRLGLDLRLNSNYFAYYYHPLAGQFTLQDERVVEFYPSVDAFLSLRVTRFRAFVKWANLSRVLITDRLFYQNAFYPYQNGSGLRLGLSWRFVD